MRRSGVNLHPSLRDHEVNNFCQLLGVLRILIWDIPSIMLFRVLAYRYSAVTQMKKQQQPIPDKVRVIYPSFPPPSPSYQEYCT